MPPASPRRAASPSRRRAASPASQRAKSPSLRSPSSRRNGPKATSGTPREQSNSPSRTSKRKAAASHSPVAWVQLFFLLAFSATAVMRLGGPSAALNRVESMVRRLGPRPAPATAVGTVRASDILGRRFGKKPPSPPASPKPPPSPPPRAPPPLAVAVVEPEAPPRKLAFLHNLADDAVADLKLAGAELKRAGRGIKKGASKLNGGVKKGVKRVGSGSKEALVNLKNKLVKRGEEKGGA